MDSVPVSRSITSGQIAKDILRKLVNYAIPQLATFKPKKKVNNFFSYNHASTSFSSLTILIILT